MTLYEIGNDMRELEEALLNIEGEVTDEETERGIDEWFKRNEDNLRAKLNSIGKLIRNQAALAEAADEEAARLRALAQSRANLATKLKHRVKIFFEEHGLQKFETELFKFWVQKNGGKPPLCFTEAVLNDVTLLPDEFIERRPFIKSDAVREALNMGAELNEMAWIEPAGTHLRLK